MGGGRLPENFSQLLHKSHRWHWRQVGVPTSHPPFIPVVSIEGGHRHSFVYLQQSEVSWCPRQTFFACQTLVSTTMIIQHACGHWRDFTLQSCTYACGLSSSSSNNGANWISSNIAPRWSLLSALAEYSKRSIGTNRNQRCVQHTLLRPIFILTPSLTSFEEVHAKI